MAEKICYCKIYMSKNGEKINMGTNEVTILGARGSLPVSGAGFTVYGGATACVLLETEDAAIVFDAGTGLLSLPERVWKTHKTTHVMISHLHLDHLLGIPMSQMLYDPQAEVVFYAADADACEKAIRQFMQPPLWPVGPESFGAKITYRSIGQGSFAIPDSFVTMRAMSVCHPGGCLVYRADWDGGSIVYATDCELDEVGSRELMAFAEGAGLMLLDAQYTEREYDKCRGFGHNDLRTAVTVLAESSVERGLLYHHAPTRTDAELIDIERRIQQAYPQISMAREGDTLKL